MNLLYIDPGTGSMIFSAIIALATTLVFGVRALAIKLKFVFQGGGKNEKIDKANQGIVIFSDDKRYWNVFAPICVEAEKRGINLVYMTQSADDPALSEKFQHVKCEFIGEGNKGFTKLNFLNADIVLSTTPHLDVYQWKRSKNVKFYVHIPHAIDDLMGYRMFGTDSYDAILTCGEFAENWLRRLEKMRGIKQKELVVVGYPPLDEQKIRLESEHNVVASEPLAASEACGKTKQSKTILVAPSWGKSAILSRYGEKFLSSLVATGYKIVVRPHPQSKTSEKEMLDTLMKKFPQNENFLWNFDNDNFLAMKNADLLITDFSGIIFDFAFILTNPFFMQTRLLILPFMMRRGSPAKSALLSLMRKKSA